ncbi:MAG: SCO family protein [Verrucomicrobiota bacterium]
MTEPLPSSKPSRPRWIIPLFIIGGLALVGINVFYGLSMLRQPSNQQTPTAETLNNPIPSFSFTDQAGHLFDRSKLDGKVWVASFIFTRCPGPCPVISQNMSVIHQAFLDNPNVVLVSFSLDPEYDSPEVLTAYAEGHQATYPQWRFLTGAKEKIHQLSMNDFYSAVLETDPETAKDAGPIIHGTRISVIDQNGTLVAAYNGVTNVGTQQVISKVKDLLK